MLRWALLAFAVAASSAPIAVGQQSQTAGDSRLVRFVDVDYPPSLMTARVEGVVVIRATLAADGSVAEASAVSGKRPLIALCLENAKQWKFKLNGPRQTVIVYNFRLDEGACHTSTRSVFLLEHFNAASIVGCRVVVDG